jgi:hypothetical protein
MLVPKRKHFLLTGFLLILLVFGCQPKVKTISKVELSRTPEIKFILKNETAGTLKILPVIDPLSDPSIDLSPGKGRPLSFYLVRIADLEKTNHSWMRPVRGSETNMIISGDAVSYIDVQGEDGLIRMRNDQGRMWTLLLDIESCYEYHDVVEEIIITGPPDPILPTAVCE